MIALFFPHTGLLNPLDSPHHMRIDDESEYREGIVLDRPSKQGKGSLVNCGMRKVRMYQGRRWTHKKGRLLEKISNNFSTDFFQAINGIGQ